MKALTVLFFLVCSFESLHSQTLEELDERITRLYEAGEFQQALPFARDFLKQTRQLTGSVDTNYAYALNTLAMVYAQIGSSDTAKALFQESINILEKFSDGQTLIYANTLNNLADIHQNEGSYTEAERLLKHSIAIKKVVVGEDHADYAYSLSNLALLYQEKAEYATALSLLQQASEILAKVLGLNHPDYASVLVNLAQLYASLGMHEKALALTRKSLLIVKETVGTSHPEYAQILSVMGHSYEQLDSADKALPLYESVLQITKDAFGEKDRRYYESLMDLGIYHYRQQNFKTSLTYALEALNVAGSVHGTSHAVYAEVLHGLGNLYTRLGSYQDALTYYKKAVKTTKDALGKSHPQYVNQLKSIALLYERQGDYENATYYLIQSATQSSKNLTAGSRFLSQEDLMRFVSNGYSDIETAHSFAVKIENSALKSTNLESELLLKGIALQNGRDLLDLLNQNADSSLNGLIANLKNLQLALASAFAAGAPEQETDSLSTQLDLNEQRLMQKSNQYQQLVTNRDLKWYDVQGTLTQNEAAIEFVRFRYWNKKWTDSVLYAAYIIRKKDSIPVFVRLFEERQLEHILTSAGTNAQDIASNIYRGATVSGTALQSLLSNELYTLLWRPLEPYLQNIKTISYSPAGQLHNIAFHALAVDSTTLLLDKYKLQQYASLRQVALRARNEPRPLPSSIQLFGDPTYTADVPLFVSSQKSTATNLYTPDTRGSSISSWGRLPGTAKEVTQIEKLFQQKKFRAKSFTQTAATEEALKALSGHCPQVLHIATHGFFLPQKEEKKTGKTVQAGNTFTMAQNPLMRSGLVFSGANHAWSGKEPVDGIEDGIATAYEISQLDLSGAELVVLSACETALGDIKGSEGVFGLQRAFKMAGVENMIVSLWQVPDKETAELMTDFYTHWMAGETISDAFAQAQATMRRKYEPFYWAAFVLVQ